MMELLPDLPGTITGIKCKDPFIVQCPTCGDVVQTLQAMFDELA